MKLLMISGDRSILQGKMGAFWYTLEEMRHHWDRIDIICPHVPDEGVGISESGHRFTHDDSGHACEIFFHPSPSSLAFQKQWILKRGQFLIEQEGHDVMTVHDYPPFYNGRGAALLSKNTGVPYALEVHHIVGWPKAANFQELIGRLWSPFYFPRAAKKADVIRVVNETVAKQLQRYGVSQEKIKVISSFYLDRDVFNAELRPPVAYDVSFCGRLVANKGLSELIDAIALVPEARLLIVGDGPERQAMENKARALNINNRVTFLGWLPTQEAVSGAIQTARMFVMSSKSEGGPRIALEAMACGLPVVVTPVGVMPEVVQDGINGMFTDGSSADLAEKIRLLIADEALRDRLGKEASKILDRFERKALIKEYADSLKKLAS